MFDGIDTIVQPLFIGPTLLSVWLDRVRPHLDRMAAGSGGRFDTTDIVRALTDGAMHMWVAIEGATMLAVMVTEIHQYPRCRAMRCVGVSGHRPWRWMHLLACVERAAKENFGCDLMEAMHQAGHDRLLRTGGWRPFHVLSEKALT